MEPRFGHDFSRVQVHTDGRAAESARAVNAHAYTVGSSIVFAAGRYAPQTDPGRRLLAHELTHVVQQAGVAQMGSGALAIGGGNTAEEQAAERFAGGVSWSTDGRPGFGRKAARTRALLQRQPKPGLAPGNEHVFSSEDGVKVVVFRKCGTAEFGFQAIETATRQAFEKIFKTECISADRRTILQKNLKQFGLKIFCKQPNEMELGKDECAESSPDGQVNLSSNTFSQNKNFSPLCADGNLADVMLHELMHASLGAQTEELPRSCENSCFGNDRGTGPELCKNPRAPNTRD